MAVVADVMPHRHLWIVDVAHPLLWIVDVVHLHQWTVDVVHQLQHLWTVDAELQNLLLVAVMMLQQQVAVADANCSPVFANA